MMGCMTTASAGSDRPRQAGYASGSAPLRRSELAKIIDHTLLKPESTGDEILVLCADAARLGVSTVCVAPTHVFLAAASARREGSTDEPSFKVASTVGFPHGNHLTPIKAEEARRAVADGADEIDMVIDIANAMDDNWRAIEAEVAEVRLSIPRHVVLKVIIESALLPDESIDAACRAVEAGGAEYVKTSTGFHPAGGASLRAVRAMSTSVGGRLGIKASGGIRTAEMALQFVDAGATRLGLSATKEILAELPA